MGRLGIRLVPAIAALVAALFAGPLAAHPFDKVVPKINVRADLTKQALTVEYTFEYRTLDASLEEQAKPQLGLDADGDRVITRFERETRIRTYCEDVAKQAHLSLDNREVALTPDPSASAVFKLMDGGEVTEVGDWLVGYVLVLRSPDLAARLTGGTHAVSFYNAEGRLKRGTSPGSIRGIVVQHDTRLDRDLESDALDGHVDTVDGRYDRITFSFDMAAKAALQAAPVPAPPTDKPSQPPPAAAPVAPAARAASNYDPTAQTTNEEMEGKLRHLLTQIEGGGGAMFLALLGVFLLGMWHGVQPGHGKTLVAGYLIGSYGRKRDALTLGLTVTLAHTSGVFILLGVWKLFESLAPGVLDRQNVADILMLAIGGAILCMGAGLLLKRARGHKHEHDVFGGHTHGGGHEPHSHDGLPPHSHGHDHDHDHAGGHSHAARDPRQMTTWEVIRLGVLGGLLPCPTALVIALLTVLAGKELLGFGLLLVFSAGLATVLSAIGLVLVATKGYLSRRAAAESALTRWLSTSVPVLGALAITLIGFVLVLSALQRFGIEIVGVMF